MGVRVAVRDNGVLVTECGSAHTDDGRLINKTQEAAFHSEKLSIIDRERSTYLSGKNCGIPFDSRKTALLKMRYGRFYARHARSITSIGDQSIQ